MVLVKSLQSCIALYFYYFFTVAAQDKLENNGHVFDLTYPLIISNKLSNGESYFGFTIGLAHDHQSQVEFSRKPTGW